MYAAPSDIYDTKFPRRHLKYSDPDYRSGHSDPTLPASHTHGAARLNKPPLISRESRARLTDEAAARRAALCLSRAPARLGLQRRRDDDGKRMEGREHETSFFTEHPYSLHQADINQRRMAFGWGGGALKQTDGTLQMSN